MIPTSGGMLFLLPQPVLLLLPPVPHPVLLQPVPHPVLLLPPQPAHLPQLLLHSNPSTMLRIKGGNSLTYML